MDTLFSLEITATDMLYVPAEVRIFVAIEGGIAGARDQFQDSDGDNMLGPGDTIIAHEEIAVWYEAEDAGQSHKVILRTDVAGEARRDLFTGSWAAE